MLKVSLSAKNLICFSLATLILLVSLCGCTQKSESVPESNAVTFEDALGRNITLDTAPTRVAALIGSFAEVWQLAGGTVCATAEDEWEDFGLTLDDAVNIGGAHSPNLEMLLSAEPQFVIASASTSSNVEMKDSLEAAGITVAYFDVDSFYDYLDMLKICTKITGRDDLYQKNGSELLKRVNQVKENLGSDSFPEAHRKILLLRASSGLLKAKGSEGTVLGEMLSDLGCINIADSDTSLLENLSVESVIREEPYRIFVVTMGNDTEAAKANLFRTIKENPAWEGLEAVKSDRLHIMDRRLFNIKPNARWAEAYEILEKTLQS